MGKIVTVSLADAKRAALSEPGIARQLPDSEIDFSDIPELTGEQLRRMRRVGRPPSPATRKRVISIRIRPDVLSALRAQALRRKTPYQTYIHNILERAAQRGRKR